MSAGVVAGWHGSGASSPEWAWLLCPELCGMAELLTASHWKDRERFRAKLGSSEVRGRFCNIHAYMQCLRFFICEAGHNETHLPLQITSNSQMKSAAWWQRQSIFLIFILCCHSFLCYTTCVLRQRLWIWTWQEKRHKVEKHRKEKQKATEHWTKYELSLYYLYSFVFCLLLSTWKLNIPCALEQGESNSRNWNRMVGSAGGRIIYNG